MSGFSVIRRPGTSILGLFGLAVLLGLVVVTVIGLLMPAELDMTSSD